MSTVNFTSVAGDSVASASSLILDGSTDELGAANITLSGSYTLTSGETPDLAGDTPITLEVFVNNAGVWTLLTTVVGAYGALASNATNQTATWSAQVPSSLFQDGQEYKFTVSLRTDNSPSSGATDPGGGYQEFVVTTSRQATAQLDSTPPDAPTIDLAAASDSGASATDNITNDTTPTLSGAAEAGSTVEVFDGATSLGTATADGAGAWTLTPTLAAGSHSLTAKAKDAAGNVSGPSTTLNLTIDTSAPAAGSLSLVGFTDTGANTSDGLSSDDTFTLAVSGNEAGSSVAFQVQDGANWVSANTTGLADGTYVFRAEVTDAAGNVAHTATQSVTIDKTAPAAGTLSLMGFTDTGANTSDGLSSDDTFTLAIAGHEVGSSVVFQMQDGATWMAANTTGLADGAYVFRAEVTDAAGNVAHTATKSVTIDKTAPAAGTLSLVGFTDTGANTSDGLSSDDTFTLAVSGAEAGASVAFQVQDGASWVAANTTGLADGTYVFRAEVTDAAGNVAHTATKSVTIDKTAPAAGSLSLVGFTDTGANTSDGLSSDDTFTLAVSGNEPGSSVAFQMQDGATWVAANTTGLADGAYVFRAEVTDAAGNVAHTATQSVTIDKTAPAAGTLSLAGFTDTGANTSDGLSSDDTFTLAVSGNEPGSSVAFQVQDGATWVSANTTGLADGTYVFRAEVTDAAGNVAHTPTQSVTIDKTAPGTPTLDLAAASDLGVSSTDNITKDATPTLVGTAEAGAEVKVFDGAVLLGGATADISGVWSFTPGASLADAIYALTVKAVDAAGNTSPASTGLSVTIDTSVAAPGVALAQDTGSAGDGVTNNGAVNVTLASDLASWQYTTNGGTSWTSGSGASFTLAEGVYAAGQVQVKQTDVAGNESAGANLGAVTIDQTVAAPGVALAQDTGRSASDGVTKNGAVNVSLASDVAAWQYTTNGGASWSSGSGTSFTLAQGVYAAGQVQVKQTDIAGNASLATALGGVTVDTQLTAADDTVAVNEDAMAAIQWTTLFANDGESGLVVTGVATTAATGNNPVVNDTANQFVLFEASDSDLDVLEPGQTQAVSFQYTVEDLAGNTATRTVTVNVQGMVEAMGSGVFRGSEWADLMQGSGAADKLHGLAGNDTIIGAGGADMLQGGIGSDVFHYEWRSEFGDQIFDFQVGAVGLAADKLSFNVGPGQIEIGDNDSVVDPGEILFLTDRAYSRLEIQQLTSAANSEGRLVVGRMSDTNAATVWYDGPGAGSPVLVVELMNVRAAKDMLDMSSNDFLFV